MTCSNISSRLRFLFICCILPGTSFAQTAFRLDVPTGFSFDDPKYNSLVVAHVGHRAITAQEFLLNYAFGPSFAKREEHSKRRYLDFMVYEKLLALDGYAHGVDTTDAARQALAEVTADLATEELYRDDVLSKVSVTEEAIGRGVQQDRLTLSIQWLYARAAGEIAVQLESLRRGVPFDSLFARQLRDGVGMDDRSMKLSAFKLHMRNPALAAVVDTLRAGNVSASIAAPDGFYIVKIMDVSTNPIMTSSEEAKLRDEVRRALIEHIADSLSDLYVERTMVGHHPTILRRPFDRLHAHLAKTILPESTFAAWNLSKRLRDRWGSDSLDERQQVVDVDGSGYTIRDFLRWYHAREQNLHLNPASPELLFSSLERLMWVMVRDKLLTERAHKRGLDRREIVKRQTQWWKDKIVYKLVRTALADSIQCDEAALRAYYAEHRKHYRSGKGEELSFERARDGVLRDLVSYELTKRSVHKILKLKEEYHVTVNESVLNNLYVDTENNPRAIDVYAMKKGGIFPRPAFPTIDEEWQQWN